MTHYLIQKFFLGSLPSFSFQSLRSSLRFLLPSVLYAINNNLYYAGLTLVPPPIWLILCSVRTVVTASIYKVSEFKYEIITAYSVDLIEEWVYFHIITSIEYSYKDGFDNTV